MKPFLYLCSLGIAMAATQVSAQTIDGFEGYATEQAFKDAWKIGGNANEFHYNRTDGGAASTTNYMEVTDEAWGLAVTAASIYTPAPGNYKLGFYFKQGLDAAPMKNLEVVMLQDGNQKVSVPVPATAQAAWTFLESGAVTLSGNPVTIQVKASNGAAPVAGQVNYKMAIDEIALTAISSVPLDLSVFPDSRIYLSRNKTIVATPKFGSETYSKVEFNVNDDATVEFTDTTAPFEFDWNTLVDVPQDTSRTLNVSTSNTPVPLRVTVTDSNNNTKSVLLNYTIDNRFDGRESLIVNGDFSAWQGTGTEANLPVGWVEQNISTNPTYGPGASYSTEAGDALRIKLGQPTSEGGVFPDRYVLRTVAKTGTWRDLQTYFWGKGLFARLYYLTSSDDGATFVTTQQDAGIADGTAWTFAVQVSPPRNLGLTLTSQVALGTHQTGTTDHYWDDIVSEGMKVITSEVDGWNLY